MSVAIDPGSVRIDEWSMGPCVRRAGPSGRVEVFRTAIPRGEEFAAGKYSAVVLTPVAGGDVIADDDPFYVIVNALEAIDRHYRRFCHETMNHVRALPPAACDPHAESHFVRTDRGLTFSGCRVGMLARHISAEFGALVSIGNLGPILVMLGGRGYGVLAPRAKEIADALPLWPVAPGDRGRRT